MTHEELLEKIDSKLDKCTCDGRNNNCFHDDNVPWLILGAVAQLHKPNIRGGCDICSWTLNGFVLYEVCPIIQAIEKELV